MINKSFKDKSIFEYLIGLERNITFDFMFWPLVVFISYFRSERFKVNIKKTTYVDLTEQ